MVLAAQNEQVADCELVKNIIEGFEPFTKLLCHFAVFGEKSMARL